MIVLAGASASGKTEVAKALASKYGITKTITTTTRPMRQGEVDGKDYFFVDEKTFQKMIKDDRFVEYTTYNNYHYGSTKDQIASNKCIVVDPIGLKAYISLNDSQIITFFLDCSEAIRCERMKLRGDNPDKIKSRLIHDREAFKEENIPEVDHHIDSENNNVMEVAEIIYQIYQDFLSNK